MLGKRARPPMKRTTSMTELTLELNGAAEGICQPLDPQNPFKGGGDAAVGLDQPFSGSAARPNSRNSADFIETAHFLRVCSLCKRRLIPGRDIYMYRGDSAFCSLECRQQQMAQDEKKDKCSLSSQKEAVSMAAAQVSATGDGRRRMG